MVDPDIIRRFPDVAHLADELTALGRQYAALEYPPVLHGEQTIKGLAWRCRCMAYASRLRAEEVLKLGILAVNEGAVITAFLISRALDETLAYVVFARRTIERGVSKGDARALESDVNKLVASNLYLARRGRKVPKPFRISDMVKEVDEYFKEILAGHEPEPGAPFHDQYEFSSEFAHPSHGSFAAYQRRDGTQEVFDRGLGERLETLPALLRGLLFSGRQLLREAERLGGIPNLPDDWPGFAEVRRATP